MGRLTNAGGLRLNIYSSWKNKNISVHDGTCLLEAEYYAYLESVLSSVSANSIISKVFNFLIGSIQISRVNNGIICRVGIYDGSSLENPSSILHKDILQLKLNLAERIIFESASKFFKQPVKVQFYYLTNKTLTAELLLNYIQIKLYQRFSVNEVLFSLKELLELNNYLLGYRLDFSGRFSRKQRASSLSFKAGQVQFSTRSCFIDFRATDVTLKYGKCGIKVWLNLSKNHRVVSKEKLF